MPDSTTSARASGCLFETYVGEGSVILDLGVGGGRTTPFLSRRASRYVGLDYSSSMVERCRAKFSDLQFRVGDAADLSELPDCQFDAVVFAYNGIDFVLPEASRQSCWKHISRVLKPGGTLIFSSHNARAVFVSPGWNLERLRNSCSSSGPEFENPARSSIGGTRAHSPYSRFSRSLYGESPEDDSTSSNRSFLGRGWVPYGRRAWRSVYPLLHSQPGRPRSERR